MCNGSYSNRRAEGNSVHVSRGWAHIWPPVKKQSQLPTSMTVCQQASLRLDRWTLELPPQRHVTPHLVLSDL